MDWTTLLPLALPAMILALSAVALVCGTLSTQSEAKQASRVGRIEGAVGRAAGSMVAQLQASQAAGASPNTLATMQQLALSAGAAYVQTTMPDTLKDAGATTATLMKMIEGEAGKLMVTASPPVPVATPDLPPASTVPAAAS